MIDKATKDMTAKHSMWGRLHERSKTPDKSRERWIGIFDRPSGVSRTVKHVPKSRFDKDATFIGEIARGLLGVQIGLKLGSLLFDVRERWRGSQNGLLARRRMHCEMLDAAGYSKTDARAQKRGS